MVKKNMVFVFVISVLTLAAFSRAGWLPFKLDKPERNNPFDPLNPVNLQKAAGPQATATPCGSCPTPTPTNTPCAGCGPNVILAYPPASPFSTNIPYPSDPIDANSTLAKQVTISFFFDQDMDTYSLPGSVTISPIVAIDYIGANTFSWNGTRELRVSFSTDDSFFWSASPGLKFLQSYNIQIGPPLKGVNGQALTPFSRTIQIGAFGVGMADGADAQSAGYSIHGHFRLMGANNGNWASVTFNKNLDTSQSFSGKFSSSIPGMTVIATGIFANNVIGLNISGTCTVRPDTGYLLNVASGIKSTSGDVMSSPYFVTLTSAPLDKVGFQSFPIACQVRFPYPMNITSTSAAILISPAPTSTSWVSSGSWTYNSVFQINHSFASGTVITITMGVGVCALSGDCLSAPEVFTVVVP